MSDTEQWILEKLNSCKERPVDELVGLLIETTETLDQLLNNIQLEESRLAAGVTVTRNTKLIEKLLEEL